jgi:hypothetical protein
MKFLEDATCAGVSTDAGPMPTTTTTASDTTTAEHLAAIYALSAPDTPLPVVTLKRAERLQLKRQFQDLILNRNKLQKDASSSSSSLDAAIDTHEDLGRLNSDRFIELLIEEYTRFLQLRLWMAESQPQVEMSSSPSPPSSSSSPPVTTIPIDDLPPPLLPSYLIDTIWRAHMMVQNGNAYDTFCSRNEPTMNDVDVVHVRYHDELLMYVNERDCHDIRQTLYNTTLRLYQQAFKESPSCKVFGSRTTNTDAGNHHVDDGANSDDEDDIRGIHIWPPGVDDRPSTTTGNMVESDRQEGQEENASGELHQLFHAGTESDRGSTVEATVECPQTAAGSVVRHDGSGGLEDRESDGLNRMTQNHHHQQQQCASQKSPLSKQNNTLSSGETSKGKTTVVSPAVPFMNLSREAEDRVIEDTHCQSVKLQGHPKQLAVEKEPIAKSPVEIERAKTLLTDASSAIHGMNTSEIDDSSKPTGGKHEKRNIDSIDIAGHSAQDTDEGIEGRKKRKVVDGAQNIPVPPVPDSVETITTTTAVDVAVKETKLAAKPSPAGPRQDGDAAKTDFDCDVVDDSYSHGQGEGFKNIGDHDHSQLMTRDNDTNVRLPRGSKVWVGSHIATLLRDWMEGDDVAQIRWDGYRSGSEFVQTSDIVPVVENSEDRPRRDRKRVLVSSSRTPTSSSRTPPPHPIVAKKGELVWIRHGQREESLAVLASDWFKGDQTVSARWESWQNRYGIILIVMCDLILKYVYTYLTLYSFGYYRLEENPRILTVSMCESATATTIGLEDVALPIHPIYKTKQREVSHQTQVGGFSTLAGWEHF